MTEQKPVAILDPERRIGTVQEVNTGETQILIDQSCLNNEDLQSFSIGDFLVIANQGQALYAKISDLKSANTDQKHAVAQFLLTISVKAGEICLTPGVNSYPQSGAQVYLADPRLIQYISESELGSDSNGHQVQLELANLMKHPDSPINFTPERLFGRHCAILGTSGSGKSWSLAKIIEESAKFQSKIILFDATGEYYALKGGVRHVYLGEDPNPRPGSIQIALPYQQLKEVDLFAIFKPAHQSQAPKLHYAIKTLKLLNYATQLGYNGVFIKAHKEKLNYEAQYRKYYKRVEDPYCNFDIQKLSQQIENECVYPNRSFTEPHFWGAPNTTELGECTALVNRINDIINSPNLACIFNSAELPSLFDEIENFLADPNSKVLRISLQYLSFAYGVREILANSLGRRLLELARHNCFKQLPLVVILDEAHQFLNDAVVNPSSEYPLDSFSLIAKEGRKYGLTVCLATQRPRDIPEGVLSQIGTMLVHRLINDLDRKVIERASGEMQSELLSMLPALGPGESVVVGVDYSMPLCIQMIPPENKPDSSGPNYQKFWG